MLGKMCSIQVDIIILISKTGVVSVLVDTLGTTQFSRIIELFDSCIELSIGTEEETLHFLLE